MNYDEYGEVINGESTFETIAMSLVIGDSVFVGWNDEDCTHYDVLFTLRPKKYGLVQGGLHNGALLFVSIMKSSNFAFDIHRESRGPLFPSYVGEKLRLGENVTTEKMTELINGVIHGLGE